MQLRDLLSTESFRKLKSVKHSGEKKSVKSHKKASCENNKGSEGCHCVVKEKTENTTYKDNLQEKKFVKKTYIKECPFCGGSDLEITSNGYYYCDACGVKVEKR